MLPQAALLAIRPEAPRAIVVHTTSATFARQVAEEQEAAPEVFAGLAWWAKRRYARLGLPFFGHVLVGPGGDVEWLAPVDRIAYHARDLNRRYDDAGWRAWGRPWDGKWTRHRRDPVVVWDWFDARWPGIETPLAFPTGRHPNLTAIGIDLLPLPTSGRHDEYTARQVEAAADLVAQLCRDYSIPHVRGYVLAHEDIDPCRRGIVRRRTGLYGVPWDPGPRLDWAALGLEA